MSSLSMSNLLIVAYIFLSQMASCHQQDLPDEEQMWQMIEHPDSLSIQAKVLLLDSIVQRSSQGQTTDAEHHRLLLEIHHMFTQPSGNIKLWYADSAYVDMPPAMFLHRVRTVPNLTYRRKQFTAYQYDHLITQVAPNGDTTVLADVLVLKDCKAFGPDGTPIADKQINLQFPVQPPSPSTRAFDRIFQLEYEQLKNQ